MVPSFHCEIATDEFLPSLVYKIFDEPAFSAMRRP
jgi:hypothetical protein